MHKRHRHYRQSKVSKDSSETDGDGDEDEKASGSPCHDLRRLIREKERELHEINEFRSKSLESLAAAKATEVEELKARQAQIRNDFNYNLKLLEERDAELERYDRLFRKMSTNLADRDEEIERLKVIVNDQAASIASFQDQVKAQRDASRRQLMESETALTTLKADHESALATQSESFAAIKKDLMARVASAEASADKRISAVVEEHQQALERMARQHDVEIAEAKRLFSQYQKEQEVDHADRVFALERASDVDLLQAKLQDLQSSLATEKANAEGVSILAQSALAEKDAALKLVEAENAQLVKLKHDLLQQYEEKVGSVLNSLHALEVQFAEQRLKHEEELRQAHAERETDVVARTSQLQAQLDASHSDATRLQASLHEANRALQETRAALDEERKVSLARQQALTECETDNRVLVERCNTLRQIIDERNDHVAVLKDLVRHTIEEMKTEQERAREAQRASDLGLHDKVAQAQERTEQVIQSLIAARPTGASVAGQAENLGELQSGLLSIKKDLRTRSMAGSDGGSSSSRRPSLGQLPRAEQVLATIPDMPAIPEMSLRTRRQSSTVLHPMDVKILQSPQNLVVDHQASDNQGPLHTIDDIDCDDGGSQSNGSSSGTQSSAKSYRRSLNSTLRGGGVGSSPNGFQTMDTVIEGASDDDEAQQRTNSQSGSRRASQSMPMESFSEMVESDGADGEHRESVIVEPPRHPQHSRSMSSANQYHEITQAHAPGSRSAGHSRAVSVSLTRTLSTTTDDDGYMSVMSDRTLGATEPADWRSDHARLESVIIGDDVQTDAPVAEVVIEHHTSHRRGPSSIDGRRRTLDPTPEDPREEQPDDDSKQESREPLPPSTEPNQEQAVQTERPEHSNNIHRGPSRRAQSVAGMPVMARPMRRGASVSGRQLPALRSKAPMESVAEEPVQTTASESSTVAPRATADTLEDVSAVKAENARLRTQIELLEEEIQRDASILALYKSEASAKTPVDDEQTRQLAERTNQLEKDLETAQRELAAVRQELDKARSDVQKADDEVQAIRYQSADEIARLNAALKDIEDRPVDRTAFDNATAKMTSLTQQVKDLQAQNDELRARASAVADAVPDLDSVLDELRQVRAQQSAGRDQSSRELQDQNQLLTEQNGKLRLAITDMRSEMEAFASVQASMADQVAHLKDANQDHVKRIALLSTPSASGGEREELHLLREQVDKMMRAVDTSYDRVVDAERRNAEQRRQLREQQSNDQKQELEQALSRLEHIVKHNAVLEAEVARLQNAPRAGNERPEKNNVAEREFFQEQIHEHIQEIASLHRELANAQARCASLQDEVRLRVQDLEEANVKIGMIDVLKSRISKLEADLDDARRNPVVQVDAGELLALREENGNLRAKLDEANYELDLLAAEKDRLMEISNMLKANVARLMSDEAVADLPLSVLDMNSDVSKAYATKLSQVERTLRDLLQQNQALRAQIVKGGGAIGSPFLHRHPGMGSEYCSDPLCQLRLVHAYGADLIVKGAAEQQVINRLDKLDEDIRRSIAEEQKPPDISDMRAVAQEAENENAAPGVAGECDVVPERVESRARQRLRKELGSLAHPGSQDKVLDLARRSFRAAARQQQRQPDPHLAMTGSAVELGADPGPGFQRGPTPSQVEAERRQRLARLHRKRQQLLNQRRAIRNYNDP